MTNIYLDIDGVILPYDVNPVKHADEFIIYIVNNYPVYWLTNHCRKKELFKELFDPVLNRCMKGELDS